MKRPIMVLFFLLLCVPLWNSNAQQNAQAPPDPAALLRQANEAVDKIQTAEFELEQEALETKDSPRARDARIWMRVINQKAGKATGAPERFLISGKSRKRASGLKEPQPTSSAQIEFALAHNGRQLRYINHTERSVTTIAAPRSGDVMNLMVTGGLLPAGLVVVSGLSIVAPIPPARMTSPGKAVYEGIAEVAGVPCHVISQEAEINAPTVPPQKMTLAARFYIGVDDHLPRRKVAGTLQLSVRILRVNQPLDATVFALNVPTGFREETLEETKAKRASIGLLAEGAMAPAWKLRDAAGKEHALADYRGQIVVLDFWATWCRPCIAAMPVLQGLHEKYQDKGVVVLGVSTREEGGDPAAFMQARKFTYGLLLNGETIAEAWKASVLPTLYVIGRDGKILYGERGYSNDYQARLYEAVEAALRANTK